MRIDDKLFLLLEGRDRDSFINIRDLKENFLEGRVFIFENETVAPFPNAPYREDENSPTRLRLLAVPHKSFFYSSMKLELNAEEDLER